MTRPTTEQVELALLCAEVKTGEEVAHVAAEDFYRMPDVLAAEVRALRKELEEAQGATLYHICLELKRKIARVEALGDRWLKSDETLAYLCGDALRDVLRRL